MSQAPPVDPASAAGNPHPDSTDPAARRPPGCSADPGQGSYGGFGDIDMRAVKISVGDGVSRVVNRLTTGVTGHRPDPLEPDAPERPLPPHPPAPREPDDPPAPHPHPERGL